MAQRKPDPVRGDPFDPLAGAVSDTIDLHGFTGGEAVLAVRAFVVRVQKRAPASLVHVITGRGRGSAGKPVLKTRVRTLLKGGTLPVAHWAEDLDGGGFLLRLK